APHAFEPLVPAAAPAVVFVAHRVLPVIVLVLLPGRIKGLERFDGHGDGLIEALLKRAPAFCGQPLLVLVADENRRPVAVAAVAELAAAVEWIDVAPVDLQQVTIANPLWVVDDLHDFQMAGAAAHY